MQPIHIPRVGDSPELNEQRAKLDKAAATIAADVAALDREEAEFRDAPADHLCFGAAESIRDRRLALITKELAIREKIALFDTACREALLEKWRGLNGDLERARDSVQAMLLQIGYEAPMNGMHSISAVTPAMIAGHPTVRNITNQIAEAHEKVHDLTLSQRNTAAIAALKDHVNKIRSRQLATA
jgi:hypothetical protein